LQPYSIQELAEEAVSRVMEMKAVPWGPLMIPAAALTAASPLAGAAVGSMTAPQDYAPEGAYRGAITGLGAGAGAGGGMLAGNALGELFGRASGAGLSKGTSKALAKALRGRLGGIAGLGGAGIGTLLGLLAGGVATHRNMPYKPWETGQPSILEQTEAAMRQRPPAPSFAPDYQGPAMFYGTDLPKFAAAAKEALFGDNEGMSDRGRSMLRQSGYGSAIGTGAGAAIAALSALLHHGRPAGLKESIMHALKWGGLGAGLGAPVGAGLGALNAYRTYGKEASSETRRIHNGMVPDQKRKKKSAPMFENMDELMHNLAAGRK
jgi:hypothetical protein